MLTPEQIQQMADTIVEKFDPEKIILCRMPVPAVAPDGHAAQSAIPAILNEQRTTDD